jgi:tRNA U34 5-carboxymethylaminomethyl modifying GTPase MnmE/TrmE
MRINDDRVTPSTTVPQTESIKKINEEFNNKNYWSIIGEAKRAKFKIVTIGNTNAGKSTLLNNVTGMNGFFKTS